MFGLFNKKDKEEEKALVNPEYLELVSKWDAFLEKIDMRFQESLTNSEEALLDNLEESNYDLQPTMTAWNGMKAQINKLSDKVEETFENSVEPQMLDYVKEWDLVDERQKGTSLNLSMYLRMERFERIIEGKVALTFYNHAIQEFNQDFNCTQCSGKLEVKADVFRSHYVSCDYCNTVNTFNPSDKIAQIRWVVENIAEYKAIEEWGEMRKAEENYNNLPCKADHEDKTDLIAAFKIREEKERIYWEKYMKERFTLLPEYKDSFEHDIEVKMKMLYAERERI